MENFSEFLKEIDIRILKLNLTKQRPVISSIGTMSVEKFCTTLQTRARPVIARYPETFTMLFDFGKMSQVLEDHAREKKCFIGVVEGSGQKELPEDAKRLKLNLDISHTGRDLKFFLTTEEEYISVMAGPVYLSLLGSKDSEVVHAARQVIPEYLPRSRNGVVKRTLSNGESVDIFNIYQPPPWKLYEPKLPDKLPALFEKLVMHLFPLKIEREYFFSWLYHSLFDRSLVYLVLCGIPGSGKNTLKLVMRALHGAQNTVDGKKSTLIDRFNSQLADVTLAWFDELHYTPEMENVMKELQNDTISIEKKNIDATRSTKIFASLVISNNKPRDNFIAFDARKFSPLFITPKRLETSLSREEIDSLVRKVKDQSHKDFDVEFIAQIGRWIKKYGKSKKWPNLEYKGPVFYKLAHTSMTRWQKRAVVTLLEAQPGAMTRMQYDKNKGYLWSTVEAFIVKGRGEKGMTFPDFSSVRHFFEIFLDGVGKKSFTTEVVQGNIMGDFWVKIINKNTKILTESDVLKDLGVEDGQEEDEEDYSYL